MTDAQCRAIAEAVVYAMRAGCFFPVPDPPQDASVQRLIQWGAMRHLHDVVARPAEGSA